MSANLRLRIFPPGGEASAGLLAALGLGVAMALGGCAMNKEPGAGDTAMSPAGTCEQQHEEAIQDCQASWNSEFEPGSAPSLHELEPTTSSRPVGPDDDPVRACRDGARRADKDRRTRPHQVGPGQTD